MILRYLHVSLSGSGADELLYLFRACLNSSFEKGAHAVMGFGLSSLKMSISTCLCSVVLKVE